MRVQGEYRKFVPFFSFFFFVLFVGVQGLGSKRVNERVEFHSIIESKFRFTDEIVGRPTKRSNVGYMCCQLRRELWMKDGKETKMAYWCRK